MGLDMLNLPWMVTVLLRTRSVLLAERIVNFNFASLFLDNSFKMNLASSNESLWRVGEQMVSRTCKF